MAKRVLALRKSFENEPSNDSILSNGFTFDNEFGDPRKENEKLHNKLFIDDNKYFIISSSPKVFSAIHKDDFGDEFFISEEELDAYSEGVLEILTPKNIEAVVTSEDLDADELLDEAALDDKDIKLSLYRSFRSLYDKWISNSGSGNGQQTQGYFFNNYGQDDDRALFDHFRFINRANSDIGGKAVIDTAYLANISSSKNGEGPTQSLYQVVTSLLSKNNFDFWPTPSNIPLTTASLPNEDLLDMFRPIDRIGKIKAGPLFNCVYIGGSSRTLRDLNNKESNCQLINMDYQDDSFDITDSTDWPEEYKNAEDSGLLVFKVRYGQEAQNHFQTLQLDQTEFKETQESLMIIDALANPEKGNSPNQTGKGNNIYDVYLTRAYNCTVTGLGNMSLQPLMYFKLENVPMFRGTYLINKVKHSIKPHNVTTEFTGLRQPKITIPIVEDPISLLDLALADEAVEGERRKRSLSDFGGSNSSGNNGSYTNNNGNTVNVGSATVQIPAGPSNGGKPNRLDDYNN